MLDEVFGPVATRGFAVRFWTGDEDVPAGTGRPPFTLVLSGPGALRRMLLGGSELAVAEAFLRGDFDVEGDLERAVALGETIPARLAAPRRLARVVRHLLALPSEPPATHLVTGTGRSRRPARLHSRRRDAAAIRAHYDVGNDFYRLWLDRRMIYSCAYFQQGTETIDAAQQAKLEMLCRKLRLEPGQRLLDIGCGWGGLARYAALHYGVRALGVTLSPAQAALANEAIYDAGLGGRCAVEVLDYRALDPSQPFDRIVSVGMFEHVGPEQMATYFATVYRLLAPGGVFLNHGIVRAPARRLPLGRSLTARFWQRGDFIDRYVFPDGELVTLEHAVGRAEDAGFEVRDVESLRDHYVLTLRRWVERLEAAREPAIDLVGPQRYRVWRLYMSASAHAFASGRIGLAQILLTRRDAAGRAALPLTRADWYRTLDA